MKYYLDASDKRRGSEMALFITSIEPHHQASKNTVAGWIRSVIKEAYNAKKEDFPEGTDLRAHSTRGVASSWALSSGVSVPEILDAAGWKTQITFASHYLKDFALQKGRFPASILTAAGKASRDRSTTA